MDLNLSALPLEIQEKILLCLLEDDETLNHCEKTCKTWHEIINKGTFYRLKCLNLRKRHPKSHSTFVRLDFHQHSFNATWCKKFYVKLSRLLKHGWDLNKEYPKVTVLDCLNVEVDGRKINVADDWDLRYDYKGIYDTVWDDHTGLLTLSIFDWIQVWDMKQMKCINLIGSDVLDLDDIHTRCFTVSGNILACGTDRGHIRLFDLLSSQELQTVRQGYQYISDIKIFGDTLMAVSWYGDLQIWCLGNQQRQVIFKDEFRPPFRYLGPILINGYNSRFSERLLDLNEDLVATNSRNLLVVFSRSRTDEACVRTAGLVMCLKEQYQLISHFLKHK